MASENHPGKCLGDVGVSVYLSDVLQRLYRHENDSGLSLLLPSSSAVTAVTISLPGSRVGKIRVNFTLRRQAAMSATSTAFSSIPHFGTPHFGTFSNPHLGTSLFGSPHLSSPSNEICCELMVEELPSGSTILVNYQYKRPRLDGRTEYVSKWVQGNGCLELFNKDQITKISGTVSVYEPPAEDPTAFYLKHGRGKVSLCKTIYVPPPPPQSTTCFSLLRDIPAALCDVVLRAAGGDFPAHRAVLAARSPVFLAMFTGHFKEAACKTVDIAVDCSADVFAAFVDFLYTGALGERDCGDALPLLELGERFLVGDLKQQCVRRLLAVGSAAEAVEVLHAALDKAFVPSEVRVGAVAVIKKHWPAASSTGAWKRFFDAHPAAAVSLEAAFADVK